MIQGADEKKNHPWGEQGADLGGSEAAKYSPEMYAFLVPISVIFHPILILLVCWKFQPHPLAHRTHFARFL